MGKIRVRTLGDEDFEKKQAEEAKARREGKKAQKEKTHVKGVGLKGGQQIKVMEGVDLTPEAQAALSEVEGEVSQKTPNKKARKIKIRTHSKRYQAARVLIDTKISYPLSKAIELLKKTATTHFDASVETHININPAILTKDKKTLSGSIKLPYGTGKKRIIAIADEEILKKIESGKIDFDILIAHPSMMPKLAKFARVLGPKGLMPNPKNGTVSPDPQKRVGELDSGEINWKTEPDQPVVHQIVGKVSYESEKLQQNITELIKAIGTNKIAKLTISSSMGPGIKVDLPSIS